MVVIIFVVGCTATTYAIGAIMTNIVNLNPAHCEVYSIQPDDSDVIKFVSDL